VAILFILAVLNAGLGMFVILGQKSIVRTVHAVFILFVAAWTFGLAMFLLSQDLNVALWSANSYYVSGTGITVFFLIFSRVFPKVNWDRAHIALASLPLIVLAGLFLSDPHFMIQEVVIISGGKDVILNGFHYSIFTLGIFVCVIWAYVNLYRSHKSATDQTTRLQLRYVGWSTGVAYALGLFFNILLPGIGNYQLIWVGPLFTIFMVAGIGYAITKHQLFNVKVVATEILVFLLWFFLLVRLVLSSSLADMLVNGLVLVTTSIFGVLLIVSVLKEVRIRKEMEKLASELSVANRKLEDLNRQKSEFVSIASHQLRTPLTAIKGYSSMLLEGSFGSIDDKIKTAISRIFDSSERLVAIVEDFLNLSRIELGRMHYEFKVVDLRKMVSEVIEELRENATAKGLNLTLEIEPTVSMNTWADDGKVRQVVSNLVYNAIKYTPQGGVTVSLVAVGNVYRFRSVDTGIGLSREDIKGLFRKYARTQEAKKVVAGGSGLGLFVADQVMRAHKSKIKVTSKGQGRGSTFTVDFIRDDGKNRAKTEDRDSILTADENNQPTKTALANARPKKNLMQQQSPDQESQK